jgi:hypothetical protein
MKYQWPEFGEVMADQPISIKIALQGMIMQNGSLYRST